MGFCVRLGGGVLLRTSTLHQAAGAGLSVLGVLLGPVVFEQLNRSG
jgi:hypothetical protein